MLVIQYPTWNVIDISKLFVVDISCWHEREYPEGTHRKLAHCMKRDLGIGRMLPSPLFPKLPPLPIAAVGAEVSLQRI